MNMGPLLRGYGAVGFIVAFAKLLKRLLASSCRSASVRLSACNTLAPTGRILIELDI
jgi:hypothetical protein